MSKGVQGDGKAVPLHKYISAVVRWLHESEDSMPQAEKKQKKRLVKSIN